MARHVQERMAGAYLGLLLMGRFLLFPSSPVFPADAAARAGATDGGLVPETWHEHLEWRGDIDDVSMSAFRRGACHYIAQSSAIEP